MREPLRESANGLTRGRLGLSRIGLITVVGLTGAAFALLNDDDSGDTPNERAETGTEAGQTEPSDRAAAACTDVGLALDLGGRGDRSYNDSAASGLDRAGEELGITPTELEPDEFGSNREDPLPLVAEEGNELVVGVGLLCTEAMEAVAPDFPNTTFALIDSVVEADHVANLLVAEEQGSLLVGATTGLTTQTDRIGFIGGVRTELIEKSQAGFEAGVAEVNPDAEVVVQYLTQPPNVDGLNDPTRGKEVGASMYEGGADIAYHAAGGSGGGLFEAASEAREGGNEVWAIGVDSDQYNTADPAVQDTILTSMIKRVDVAVYSTIEDCVNEQLTTGVNVFDLSVDGVGYSTSGGFVDDITGELDDLSQQIIDGDIEVPTTP